jgi:HD-like signal output (HDOD) protein
MRWGNEQRPTLLGEVNSLSEELERLVLEGRIKLPVLPVVATQVINMAANPNADLEDLSGLVHQDQSLAGHILRISNSALFSGAIPIRSLKDAINRLGFAAIREMATVITIKGQVFQSKQFGRQIERVWLHALISGTYCKLIAIQMSVESDIPFICGLLHTVGKPILFQAVSDLGESGNVDTRNEMVLMNLVDRLHSFVGKEAAKAWKLPPEVGACCKFFKDRWDAGDCRKAVAITVLASRLANWCLEGGSNLKNNILHDSTVKELGLDPEQIEHFCEEKNEVLDSVRFFH